MSGDHFRSWLWGSGITALAAGAAFSLHDPTAGGVGGTTIIIGVVLCTKAYLTKP